MLAERRRRRALVKIRREFARSGHPLDGHSDSDIEASLPPGMCDTPPAYLGAKTISRALRRLSNGAAGERGHARKGVTKDDCVAKNFRLPNILR
jgi:hypothetical protein